MSTTSKSPRKVLLEALAVGRAALAEYSHPCSPKTYTQPQLFACLVLKTFWKTDYRGLAVGLADEPSLCQAVGLKKTPHHTTFQKAHARLLRQPHARQLLEASVRRFLGRRRRLLLAAVDSTGLEARHVSRYYVHRRSREPNLPGRPAGLWQTTTYRRFPKLGLLTDCRSHLIVAELRCRGPCPDVHQFVATVQPAMSRLRIDWLLADAGYDSEANHRIARDQWGTRTLIPPKHGRPTTKPPSGHYRRLMRQHFGRESGPRTRYGQRWQAETTISMLKRNLGDELRGRSYQAQRRDMLLMVLTHNIMVLLWVMKVFYRAGQATL